MCKYKFEIYELLLRAEYFILLYTFHMRTVLITGCSSGFGYLMALIFARNGYHVIACVRDIKSYGAKKLRQTAVQEKVTIDVIHLDITRDETIKKALSRAPNIDILINNAGYGYLGLIEETPIVDFKKIYDTNVLGTIRMVQAIVPIMRKQGNGLIINFSSINGIVPFPLFSIYSSTKFAIETLTEGLRFELKPFGIQVVMVEPGSYVTNFSKNRVEQTGLRRSKSPYKKLITNFFNRYTQTHAADVKGISKVADPQELAEAVYKIAQTNNPKLRYRVGLDAHKYFYIRKFLPFFVWEKILRKTYEW